jgi:CheB methylesterase
MRPNLPIVGIGASAGGVEALGAFLRAMPTDNGMAFVVVTHLSPTRESMLAEILGRATNMPVVDVRDGEKVAAQHVYVLPSGATLTIGEGRLRLRRSGTAEHERTPIDVFFTSLAEDQAGHAIGIVLSGGGSDGTLGLNAIKENGGVQTIRLVVVPIRERNETAHNIVFADHGPIETRDEAGAADRGSGEDAAVRQIEKELQETKDRLQSTIEELEAANVEFRLTNEEMLSVNEELQSSNEELETSKEELESVNEEPRTVNSELSYRIDELDRANNDLSNLFQSTRVATKLEGLTKRGFGAELIERGIRFELQGEAKLEAVDRGLHCRIVVPANPEYLIFGSAPGS